jgi:EAL domain-containing protein (putative c-di-GMP-specific phosphodiesterase class I)
LKESFVDTVRTAIEQAGIIPQQLEIEITEGSLESGALAQKVTTGLRNLGVMLSVDDFGTGYGHVV